MQDVDSSMGCFRRKRQHRERSEWVCPHPTKIDSTPTTRHSSLSSIECCVAAGGLSSQRNILSSPMGISKCQTTSRQRKSAPSGEGSASQSECQATITAWVVFAKLYQTMDFTIERILEPKPTGRFRKADQKEYQKLMRFPLFICIRARKIS